MKRIGHGGCMVFSLVVCLLTACGGGDGGADGEATLSSSDVAAMASSSLGGDSGAATAILMALARGSSLTAIVDAIAAGALDVNGNIVTTAGRSTISDFCANLDDDFCRSAIEESLTQWEHERSSHFYTAIILRAAARGYSVDQITVAMTATWLGTDGDTIILQNGEIEQCDPDSVDEFDECRLLRPHKPIISVFTDVSVASDDGETDDGWDEDFDDLTGEWTTQGTCPGGDSTGWVSLTGTTTLRADGTASVDWQYYNPDGSRGSRANVGADWTYASGRLTLMVSAIYTGAARPEFTRVVLSSEGCWSLTLSR